MDSNHKNEQNENKKIEKKSKVKINKIETVHGIFAIDYYTPSLKVVAKKKERLNQLNEEIVQLKKDMNKMKQELIQLLIYPLDEIKILYKPIGFILKQAKSYEIRKTCELDILIKKRQLDLLEKKRLKMLDEFNREMQKVMNLRKLFDKQPTARQVLENLSQDEILN